MSRYPEMIGALLDQLDAVRAGLSAEPRRHLDALLAELAGSADEPGGPPPEAVDEVEEIALQIADLLDVSLPPGHPFLTHLPSGASRFSPGTSGDRSTAGDWGAVLGRVSGVEVTRAVEDRLFEVPAESVEVDELWLIRLERGDGRVRVPAFQFEGPRQVWPVVREVNRILGADEDPWGVADWWLGRNAWIDAVPADLLGGSRDGELVAAALAVGGDD
ncbi:hypothetical protein [Nonomuraea sp. NPDC046570]|uniref:hypothetical protein n=1 Tax=Nonomuraea sp. NPDC046570 TaxID=3155255 RepID=UPI00340AA6D3